MIAFSAYPYIRVHCLVMAGQSVSDFNPSKFATAVSLTQKDPRVLDQTPIEMETNCTATLSIQPVIYQS